MTNNATVRSTALIDVAKTETAVEDGVGDRIGATLHFERVYDEHFPFVWRSVRRLGTPDAHVDDAVQEVFVVVHRRLQEFNGRSSMRSWLHAIVANVVRNYWRSVHRKDPRARGKGPDVETLEDARARADALLEQADGVRLLHMLMDELDWPKREVFVLIELEQMSVPEAACALGVNVNTVYSRLRAARQAFERAVSRYQARQQRRERCVD